MQEARGAGRRIPIAGKGADRARPVRSADPQPRSGDRRAAGHQMAKCSAPCSPRLHRGHAP